MGQIGYLFNLIFTFPIFNILMLLYHLFGDFGLSIIVMTLLVRLVLFPLTLKQLQSTKATQVIQPQIAEIRKKYKNQQEQAVALQALYKEHGVNPLAGCLPMLVQFPVLYGLFFALSAVLRDATLAHINAIIYPFLPHFAKFPDLNLSWFTWINSAWFIPLDHPDPTHILPIIAGIATFIQLRMAQPRATATSKDMMTQQMQTMQFIMPFITIFFGWTFPAGLALYWVTTTCFSIVQQYFITGWGSLAVRPSFLDGLFSSQKSGHKSRGTRVSVNDQRFIKDVEEPETRVVEGSVSGRDQKQDDSLNYKNDVSKGSGEYTMRRRPKAGSASARRRGNAPKRSVSRG